MAGRVADENESFLGGHRGRMLVSVSLGWAVLQTGRFAIPPLLPRITDTLAISSATAGLAITALQGVYAATQYPSGRWSDRASRASLIVPGFLTLALGFALVGLASTLAVFVLGTLIVGFGKGLYASPSRALLYDLYERRRGRALGVYSAGTDVGGLVAAGISTFVLAATTWRTPFVVVAGVLVASASLYVAWNQEPYAFDRPPLEATATIRRLLETPGQRAVIGAYALFFFFVSGFITFLPTFLAVNKGLSETSASAVFAVVFAVGLLTKPVGGTLGDRFSRSLVATTGLLVAAAMVLSLVLVPSLPLVVASLALLAIGYKAQFPLADTLVMEAAPTANVGGDLGAAKALFLGVGSLGPAFVGSAATTIGYDGAYVVLAGTLSASAVLLLGWAR